jgi:uncharacterized membrane protein (UPF0127 family)
MARVCLIFLSLFIACHFLGCEQAPRLEDKHLSITIAGEPFRLELALDPDSRFQGLSDRTEIPKGTGMIFVFPKPATQKFVMRRCHVPIDILYLEPSGRVIKTYAMKVEPLDTPEHKLTQYPSVWPAQFAIELAGGEVQRLGVKEGDLITLPTTELIKRAK